jgi:hypothetical protein
MRANTTVPAAVGIFPEQSCTHSMTAPRSSADGAGDGLRSFGAATDRKQRNKAGRDASLHTNLGKGN